MSRQKLKAAMSAGGGVAAYINREEHIELSEDELRREIYENRSEADSSGAERMARSNKRNTLLKRAGFDYFDVRELLPNPGNIYSIDQEQVKNLAGLIYESKNTTPIVIRALPEGLQIVDGHRRCEAHKLLGQTHGEAWYMIPARCFDINQLSDEDATFMLHAENMGQRTISPSERAQGFKVISERLAEQRKSDPSLKGKKTREILAEQFGISERLVGTELTIANHLIKEGQQLLDAEKISKQAAESISRLSEEDQHIILELINNNAISSEEADAAAKKSTRTKTPIADISSQDIKNQKEQTVDTYLKKSLNALKRANRTHGQPSFAITGQIKELVQEIERKRDL